MKIARNIQSQRRKLKITQEELAAKLYVTRQTVSNYENGKSNPDLETLQQIANILETDMDYLLYGEQKTKDKKAIRKSAITLGLCLLVMTAASIIGNHERELQAASYSLPFLSWFMHVLGYSVLLVVAGASMTKLIMLTTTSTPLNMKYKKVVNRSILFSFIAYSIFMFPFAIMRIIYNINYYIWKAANPEAVTYSFSFDVGTFLNSIYFSLFNLFERYPVLFAVFFIIGCLLTLTASAPANKKPNTQK